jgi:hypothetical protein
MALVAAGAVIVGGLWAAPGASAGQYPPTATSCTVTPTPLYVPDVSSPASVGFTYTGGFGAWLVRIVDGVTEDDFPTDLSSWGNPQDLTDYMGYYGASSSLVFELWAVDFMGEKTGSSPLCVIDMRVGTPPVEGASAPPDVLQQVPVPASGSCADVRDADLAWGTGVTGGWSKTWGEWARGAVCGRTLHYGAHGWMAG